MAELTMRRLTSKTINILFLQFSIVVLSFTTVVAKKASTYPLFSPSFLIWFGIEILIFGAYAVLWQQVIKKHEISVAYANKGTQVVWTLIWAILFFGEHISLNNLLGILCIVIGVVMVHRNA
ncbi:MAG: EamA family transporter [Syntrophomonadaceae bacterium]|nr:EamA family transporter [Syntrophomonadaceae bacterium]